LDVKYPAKVSFLWLSLRFFEMISGEGSADSCSKEQEIDYLVIFTYHWLRPDKEQWPITQVVNCGPGHGLE
jgi:hypothetical protein